MRRLIPLVAGLLCIAFTPAHAANASLTDAPETTLLQAIDTVRAGHFDAGLQRLDGLVQKHPNFRLAQLLYGQLLAARSGVPGAELNLSKVENNRELRGLRAEYHARLTSLDAAPAAGQVPSGILQLPADVPYVVIVDLRRSRLYVLHHDARKLRVLRSDYASIGSDGYGKHKTGDLRTPVGIYQVRSWKPGETLGAIYGIGALPLDYPNAWDRTLGRTGYGIWLHGVPKDTYARPPLATEGCVALANNDLAALRTYFTKHRDTPVILTDDLHWVSPAKQNALRAALDKAIEGWRKAWSARDTNAYLAYYAATFRTEDGIDRANFVRYKRRVNASKRHIHIAVRDLALYRYPGTSDVVMAQFTQDYKSDNYAQTSRKQQFWRQQANGTWKIVFEANGTSGP